MYRKTLVLSSVLLALLLTILGCGIRNLLPDKELPPLHGYSKIAIVFFNENPSEQAKNLPTLLSYTTGTRMSIKCTDKEWSFDQTEAICPVTEKLTELSIQPCDICQDYNLAAKLAESLQVDLVILGRIGEPEFTEERSGKIEYDMADVSVTGAARYYAIYQTAILGADLEVIDPRISQPIWNGRILGYKKYKTRYRTGNPPVSQPEIRMLADVRMDFVQKLVEKLYLAMVVVEASS
jgi:hypothetical protein